VNYAETVVVIELYFLEMELRLAGAALY